MSPSSAEEPKGNALETFNAFLAASAPTTPEYRTDIKRNTDPKHIPEGRLASVSALIGPFTYRPKTYDELTHSERIELIRDGRFREFLLHRSHAFVVSPEDLLRPATLDIPWSQP